MRLRRPLPAVQGDTLHIVGVGDNRIGKVPFSDLMVGDLYYLRDYYLRDMGGRRRRFCTTVKATPKTIDGIVAARNIGEVSEPRDPMPCKRPPDDKPLADLIETKGFTIEALHMACFVGFVALKSGAASIEDILGDCGLVHAIAHNLDIGEGEPLIATRYDLVEMARRIERAIPGHPYG